MVGAQEAREVQQRSGVVRFRRGADQQGIHGVEVVRPDLLGAEQVRVAGELGDEHIPQRPVGLLPRVALGGAHAQMDNGVRGEVLPVGATTHLPNLGAFEQRGVDQPGWRRLEEGLHHGHVERLAEAAGAAEEGRGVAGVQDVSDEGGLVHQDRPRRGPPEAIVADGQAPAARAVDNPRPGRRPYAVTLFLQLDSHTGTAFPFLTPWYHSPSRALGIRAICQRAVWIEKGDLRMDGPVDEVCKAYRAQFA